MITKKALDTNKFSRTWKFTESARHAWSLIIDKYKEEHPHGAILLPAYIGWSPNEGSGIFDSVVKSEMPFDFYLLNENLQINIESLKDKIASEEDVLVLLVHYFGFCDNEYENISNYLIENKIYFVEDCAHAWLSDLIGGECGHKGRYSFYSLHKLLPFENGGMLVDNYPAKGEDSSLNPIVALNYNLYTIYKKRRDNYDYLLSKLKGLRGIKIIHDRLGNLGPQTLPILLDNFDRNSLYFDMNNKGFGMVSLYHTLIKELQSTDYIVSQNISQKIINFPIHQDVNYTDIDEMVTVLKEILDV